MLAGGANTLTKRQEAIRLTAVKVNAGGLVHLRSLAKVPSYIVFGPFDVRLAKVRLVFLDRPAGKANYHTHMN